MAVSRFYAGLPAETHQREEEENGDKFSLREEPVSDGRRISSLPIWCSLVTGVVVLVWQLIVLHRYSLQWPNSLWTGDTIYPLSWSCSELFWVEHWCALLTAFFIPLELLVLLTDCVPALTNFCMPCLCIGAPLACLLLVAKLVLAIWGFVVVFFVTSTEVDKCWDLYNCGWWSYHGLLLLTFLGLCCCCVFVINTDTQKVVVARDTITVFGVPILGSGESPGKKKEEEVEKGEMKKETTPLRSAQV